MKTFLLLSVIVLFAAQSAFGDFLEKLGLRKKTTEAAPGLSSLSQDQIAGGLKEALSKGVEKAVSQLGQQDGFLKNPQVRIPMPEKLRKAETALRSLKQDQLADEFVLTMNRAAEQAVPAASEVFAGSVKQMSITDAQSILKGGTNAATDFFRRTTYTNLYERFLPIVKNATTQAGVTSSYKNLIERAGSLGSSNALGTFGRSLGADKLIPAGAVDVDKYVTEKALDGLFEMIAEQEKLIRENPAARTSAILQKVFGAAGK